MTRLPALPEIRRVAFFKRDELTTDLICCEVVTAKGAFLFHEEQSAWQDLIASLERLPGFRRDWYAAVASPAFAPSPLLAFERDA
ncbi:hypothetical protein [Sphingosinithalassobacter sp. CS137]|uniref:hypothetical protein n=1 Tax=Sphingosinithalassobacter sp. CS137 TaxID=2762748 RepID=UPI0021D10104|nr:hypothetical protein [Sphingosinithalassobacter sp. CS137]